MLFFSALIV